MKTKKYHTVGTIPKSNTCIKIEERGKMYTLNIQIHDRSLSRLGTDTSIKDGGVKLVLLAKISSLSEIMRLCQCFPHVCKSIVFVFVAVLYHDFIYQHSTCLAKLKTSRICSVLIFNNEKKNREQKYHLKYCMLCRKAINTNFTVFGLSRPWLESTIYRTLEASTLTITPSGQAKFVFR